jgi:hypothetical protein
MVMKRRGRLGKIRRQEAAKERAESREKRSTEDQLALILKRPGESQREIARLTKKNNYHHRRTTP